MIVKTGVELMKKTIKFEIIFALPYFTIYIIVHTWDTLNKLPYFILIKTK